MSVHSKTSSYTNSYIKSCGKEDDAAVLALSLCSNMFPAALGVAVQLDLFEILAVAGDSVGLSLSDINSRLPATVNGPAVVLDSILRLLVSHSLLTCSANVLENGATEPRYGISPVGKFFVKDESGVSFSQYQAFVAGENPAVSALKEVVLEGGTIFERMYGNSFYELMKLDANICNMFGEAMRAHSTVLMKKVVKVYEEGFKGLSSLVNVGGGSGSTLDIVISEYPSIRGINFDLPQVVQTAPPYNGVEHVGGDMFVEVPKGDAHLLKLVLHNWDDESCIKLLKKCYEALANEGKVIVMDCILPNMPLADDVHSQYASQMDLLMLAVLGGKERTEDEFACLAKKAGFAEFKVACYVYGLWIMEFIK